MLVAGRLGSLCPPSRRRSSSCSSPPAAARRRQVATLPALSPGRAGPESIFTIGSQLTTDPVGTLNQLKRLGVDRVHVYMSWSSIAPDATSAQRPEFDATDPAAYPARAWAAYDQIVRGLAARHMGIDLALAGSPPIWAESPHGSEVRAQGE